MIELLSSCAIVAAVVLVGILFIRFVFWIFISFLSIFAPGIKKWADSEYDLKKGTCARCHKYKKVYFAENLKRYDRRIKFSRLPICGDCLSEYDARISSYFKQLDGYDKAAEIENPTIYDQNGLDKSIQQENASAMGCMIVIAILIFVFIGIPILQQLWNGR